MLVNKKLIKVFFFYFTKWRGCLSVSSEAGTGFMRSLLVMDT